MGLEAVLPGPQNALYVMLYLDSFKLIQPILKCIHGIRQNHRFKCITTPSAIIQ